MTRYLVTNARYSGSAELMYRDGLLIRIDVSDTNMNAETIVLFKKAVPIYECNIEKAFSPETTVVQAEFEATFEMFWKAYNKKINKKRAEAIWDNLTKTKQVLAWARIAAYDKYLTREKWRTKADPDTYLRNEYWENEYK